MTKERFQTLFLIVVGGGVGYFVFSIFILKTINLSNLACWQSTLLTVVFPLVASI